MGFPEADLRLQSGHESGTVHADVPIYGVPTVMPYKMTLIVDTGFSAKNSTLSASASIPLSGKAGFNGSQGVAPAASSSGNGLLDTLTGTSLGVNGVVVAANFRARWGLGPAGQAILGKTATFSASKDLATATVEDRTDYSPNVKGCSPQ